MSPTPGRAIVDPPARTYLLKHCADTRCSLEDLPGAMNNRDGWSERVREIHTVSATWWWWLLHNEFGCLNREMKIKIHQIYYQESALSQNEKTPPYFLINERICLVSLGNTTFSNMFPHARHVLMTLELWTLCACLRICSL